MRGPVCALAMVLATHAYYTGIHETIIPYSPSEMVLEVKLFSSIAATAGVRDGSGPAAVLLGVPTYWNTSFCTVPMLTIENMIT